VDAQEETTNDQYDGPRRPHPSRGGGVMADSTSAPRACRTCCWWSKSAASQWGTCEKTRHERDIAPGDGRGLPVATLVTIIRTWDGHMCGLWEGKVWTP